MTRHLRLYELGIGTVIPLQDLDGTTPPPLDMTSLSHPSSLVTPEPLAIRKTLPTHQAPETGFWQTAPGAHPS